MNSPRDTPRDTLANDQSIINHGMSRIVPDHPKSSKCSKTVVFLCKLNFKAVLIWALLGCEIGILRCPVSYRFLRKRALKEMAVCRYVDDGNRTFSVDFTTRHLPDTLRNHPDTARHPQTITRHPSDTPIFGLHEATGRKSNIRIP